MRLDKFLKTSRLIKRRSVAKEVCDAGRVMVNGRPAKAATPVKEGDILLMRWGARELQVRILKTPETVRVEEASSLYEVVEGKS
ncbi:MAG TPA: RNA-binding S4 domain-containing protein [Clostridia bacterium]|nr:RNA-binding S4 domain-containing protein [Clostridia bacterium]